MSAKPRGPKPRRGGKRTYNPRLVKRDYGYFISRDRRSVSPTPERRSALDQAGLRTVDDRRPLLVHGGDLIDFLEKRQAQRKQKCAADELYCCRCRRPQRPMFNRVEI